MWRNRPDAGFFFFLLTGCKRRIVFKTLLKQSRDISFISFVLHCSVRPIKIGQAIDPQLFDHYPDLWHNLRQSNFEKQWWKRVSLVPCQRPREWCKPGQSDRLKILPELRSESDESQVRKSHLPSVTEGTWIVIGCDGCPRCGGARLSMGGNQGGTAGVFLFISRPWVGMRVFRFCIVIARVGWLPLPEAIC